MQETILDTRHISYRRSLSDMAIGYLEERFKVTYIGDFPLIDERGYWTRIPFCIFYQEYPDVENGHTNYLGIFHSMGRQTLVNGASAFSQPVIGIEADDGEIIYSSYAHDFVRSQDGSVFIDGGRDYIKSSVHGKLVELNINGDHLEIGDYLAKR